MNVMCTTYAELRLITHTHTHTHTHGLFENSIKSQEDITYIHLYIYTQLYDYMAETVN